MATLIARLTRVVIWTCFGCRMGFCCMLRILYQIHAFSPCSCFRFPVPCLGSFLNKNLDGKSKWTGPIRMCLERTPNFQGFLCVQARFRPFRMRMLGRALLRLRVDLSQKVHRFGGTFVAVRRPTKYADAIIKFIFLLCHWALMEVFRDKAYEVFLMTSAE